MKNRRLRRMLAWTCAVLTAISFSAQADEMPDQSANYQKTGNTGETAGNTAVVRAEEEHSSSFAIWLIALVAVLLIAVIIAVAFKKRKRQ